MIQPYLVRRLPDLKAAVAELSGHEAFVIDVETIGKPDGLNPRTNTITWVGLGSDGCVFTIPIQHPRGRLLRVEKLTRSGKPSVAKNPPIVNKFYGTAGEQMMPDVVMAEIEPLLFSQQLVIGHNLKFDLMSAAKHYGGRIPTGPYFDTMIANHVCDENRRSFSLKDIVPDFLSLTPLDVACPTCGARRYVPCTDPPEGVAYHKTRKRSLYYPNLGKTIPDEAIDDVARYLTRDVRFDWLLYKGLCWWLGEQDLYSVFRLEMDLYPALMAMEMEGVVIDPAHLAEMKADLTREITEIQGKVWEITPNTFELTNVDDKRRFLFDPPPNGQGLRPLKFTPKRNQPVLDQQTLEYYADRNPLAALLLEWSEKQKILSTFIIGIEKRALVRNGSDPRVHTSFTQHGAVTGRLSSREPNLQNIPRLSDVRALFVAPPGYSLVVADYDQIELRVTAHFSQDKTMFHIFDMGEDIHAGTIAAVLGIPIEDVTKDQRQIGKHLNFAVVYGAGPRRVAALTGITENDARLFLDRYYKRFPAIIPWKRQVLAQARSRGNPSHPFKEPPYVTTLLGRKRRLPGLFSHDSAVVSRAERQAINTRVQGTAAEIMKIAMIRVHKAFADTPFRLVLTVHDELLSVCPEGTEDEARDVVETAMSGIMLGGKQIINVPLVVTCGTAKRWSEAKG